MGARPPDRASAERGGPLTKADLTRPGQVSAAGAKRGRVADDDDKQLSTAYERAGCEVAAHRFHRLDHRLDHRRYLARFHRNLTQERRALAGVQPDIGVRGRMSGQRVATPGSARITSHVISRCHLIHHVASQGLIRSMPVPVKSAVFLVARLAWCWREMAAIWASTALIVRLARVRTATMSA